jgi:hypothetical protein
MKAFLLLVMLALNAAAAPTMTEIRYLDTDPDQPSYTSRILILNQRMRMDYGADNEDFILYDRAAGKVWLIDHADRRISEIPARPMQQVMQTATWPEGWRLEEDRQASHVNALYQVRLNGQLCAEYKSAPILPQAARMLRDFRRALAQNQAATWNGTPEDLRQPCNLVIDVRQAGVEYQQGLPIAIRYWDGRSRVYQSHTSLPVRPELFELPAKYKRFVIDTGSR